MARVQGPPPILLQIKSARQPAEQVVALRALKNDLVGHVQKKEAWVRHGALEPVVKILSLSRQLTRHPNGKDTSRSFVPTARPLSVEEQVRLQALQLLASFASGTDIPGSPWFLFFGGRMEARWRQALT